MEKYKNVLKYLDTFQVKLANFIFIGEFCALPYQIIVKKKYFNFKNVRFYFERRINFVQFFSKFCKIIYYTNIYFLWALNLSDFTWLTSLGYRTRHILLTSLLILLIFGDRNIDDLPKWSGKSLLLRREFQQQYSGMRAMNNEPFYDPFYYDILKLLKNYLKKK